ncbi:Protein kinase domain [Dillenia turbinata]|uniref:Protein kinase domain n=1 Tax=Dillenia turbinata TaxID=194707 RepID=A0AAN8WD25_9MAGN
MVFSVTRSPPPSSKLKPKLKPRIDKSKWAAMVRNRRKIMNLVNKTPTQNFLPRKTINSSSDSFESINPVNPRFSVSPQIPSGPRWIRGQFLGRGTYGIVFAAEMINPSDEFPSQIAVKSAKVSNSSTLQYERQLLKKFTDCKQVINCFGDFITEEDGIQTYNLLLELCVGDLANYIEGSDCGLLETQIRVFSRDILMGLDYIHSQGYVHGDVKAENILLAPKPFSFPGSSNSFFNCKISDFGLAQRCVDGIIDKVTGTRGYLGPERAKDHVRGFPLDIWAFGCVVLEMMTGVRVWYMDLSLQLPDWVSNEGRDFLARLDITVYIVLAVNTSNAVDNIPRNTPNLGLCKPTARPLDVRPQRFSTKLQQQHPVSRSDYNNVIGAMPYLKNAR